MLHFERKVFFLRATAAAAAVVAVVEVVAVFVGRPCGLMRARGRTMWLFVVDFSRSVLRLIEKMVELGVWLVPSYVG